MRREDVIALLSKSRYEGLQPAEQQELEKLLRDYTEAREIQQEFDELMKIDPFLGDEVVHDTWEALAPKVENTIQTNLELVHRVRLPRKLNFVWGISAAALVLLCLSFLLWFDWSGSEENNPSIPALAATLTFGNGEVLTLQRDGRHRLRAEGNTFDQTDRMLQIENLADSAPTSWATLTVPRTLEYHLQLPDGSVVWLNSASSLRFPNRFTSDRREVYLESGEAYFEVKKNDTAPFTVHTSQGEIRVLGTTFNIHAYDPKQVRTTLATGSILVQHQNISVELIPSQQATVTSDRDQPIHLQTVNLDNILSWRAGIHYFHDTPLSEIGILLERWFDTPLRLDNYQVGHVQFRGKLDRNQALQQFIDAINLTGDATLYWKNGMLHAR